MSTALEDPPVDELEPFEPVDGFDDDGPDDDDHGDGESRRWVTITTFDSPVEAHLARLALERDDIDAILLDELTADTMLFCLASKGVRLQVPELMADRARRVLAEARAPAEPEVDRPGDGERPRQPRVTVAALADPVQAGLAAMHLEQQGIACELVEVKFRRLGVTYGLKVGAQDAVQAREQLMKTPAKGGIIEIGEGGTLRVFWPGMFMVAGVLVVLIASRQWSAALGAMIITLISLRWFITYDPPYVESASSIVDEV